MRAGLVGCGATWACALSIGTASAAAQESITDAPAQPSASSDQAPRASGATAPSQWEEGDPVPAGYYIEQRARTGLVIAGAITHGVSYLIAVSAGTFYARMNNGNASGWLIIPVVGPALTIAFRKDCAARGVQPDTNCNDVESVLVYSLAVDAVVQAAGATMLIWGFMSPEQTLVRDEFALRVSPTRVGNGYGLLFDGRF